MSVFFSFLFFVVYTFFRYSEEGGKRFIRMILWDLMDLDIYYLIM